MKLHFPKAESSSYCDSSHNEFPDKRKRMDDDGKKDEEVNGISGGNSLRSLVMKSDDAKFAGLHISHIKTLLSVDLATDKHCSILDVNDSVILLFSGTVTITADLLSQTMIVSYDNKRILSSQGKECIDLDTNGRRWEGGVKGKKPFGYGVLYDEEGRKEYEGFMLDGIKTCYGIEYYSDIGRVKYDGCFCEGNLFGKGTLYDRNGTIEHSGLWKNNHPCSSIFDGRTIDNYTVLIEIPDSSFNDTCSFTPSNYLHSVKRIVIGDGCFTNARSFELEESEELESIIIGERCFTTVEDIDVIDNREQADGVFRVVNCPKLKSIKIGYYSFSDYHSFELSILPSLQSIDIGKYCFYWVPSFSLTGLID